MKSPAVVAATARLFKGGGVRRFPHPATRSPCRRSPSTTHAPTDARRARVFRCYPARIVVVGGWVGRVTTVDPRSKIPVLAVLLSLTLTLGWCYVIKGGKIAFHYDTARCVTWPTFVLEESVSVPYEKRRLIARRSSLLPDCLWQSVDEWVAATPLASR